MSEDFTVNLSLPYLLSGQAQKHVTVNESLSRLDALIMASVVSMDEATPPTEPVPGQAWLIGNDPHQDWSDWPGALAVWSETGWQFIQPLPGWHVWVQSLQKLMLYTGALWAPVLSDTQNLERLGLAAEADSAHPFTARLNAALLTARETGNEGSGHIRLTLNKQDSGHSASLLFQTAYSGRAEFGLLGNDELGLNVSANGNDWTSALIVEPSAGRLGLGTYPDGDARLTIDGRMRVRSGPMAFTLHEEGRLELRHSEGGAVAVQAVFPGSSLSLGCVTSDQVWRSGMLRLDPDEPAIISAHDLRPQASQTSDLGKADFQWRDLYLQNMPSVLSAQPGKDTLHKLEEIEAFVQALNPVLYYRAGEGMRRFGFVAAEVQAACHAHGFDQVALCYSADESEDRNAARSEIETLRPGELIPVLVALCQGFQQRLERLEALAEQVRQG